MLVPPPALSSVHAHARRQTPAIQRESSALRVASINVLQSPLRSLHQQLVDLLLEFDLRRVAAPRDAAIGADEERRRHGVDRVGLRRFASPAGLAFAAE